MTLTVNNKVSVIGVTSFGFACAQKPYPGKQLIGWTSEHSNYLQPITKFPGVYAKVSAQRSWIFANSDAGLCQN